MNKQNVLQPNNRILFGLKKEWSTDKYSVMYKPWNSVLSEESQMLKATYRMIPFIGNV